MKKQTTIADTVDQVKDIVRKQLDTAPDGLSQHLDSANKMVGRVEERFGFSKADAVRTMQDLFETHGDDVLNLIAKKTSLPIKRKKKQRNKKIAAAVAVITVLIMAARWYLGNGQPKSNNHSEM